MAKRKKQAEEKSVFQYANELIGLLLILLSITGLGNFGLVGGLIKKFAIFIFGNWFFLFLVLTLCLGVVLIAKRGEINYFSGRLIGIYSIIIVILLFGWTIFSKEFSKKEEEPLA